LILELQKSKAGKSADGEGAKDFKRMATISECVVRTVSGAMRQTSRQAGKTFFQIAVVNRRGASAYRGAGSLKNLVPTPHLAARHSSMDAATCLKASTPFTGHGFRRRKDSLLDCLLRLQKPFKQSRKKTASVATLHRRESRNAAERKRHAGSRIKTA